MVAAANTALRNSVPRFRGVHPRQSFATPSWQGVPHDAPTILSVSAMMDWLASPVVALMYSDMATMHRLRSGWRLTPLSASKAFWADQMFTSICPQLAGIVYKLPIWMGYSEELTSTALSLVEICRPVVPMAARRQTRDKISRWMNAGVIQSLDPPEMTAAEFLTIDDLKWSTAFPVGSLLPGSLLREYLAT